MQEWYVKKEDESVYGPISVNELTSWSAEGRISPEDRISTDKIEWVAPREKPELHMDWTLELEDGSTFGPIHLLAFTDFVAAGEIDLATEIKNIRHDVTYQLGKVLLPALAESNNSLRDSASRLAFELDQARQSSSEAEPTPTTPATVPVELETEKPEREDRPETVKHASDAMKKAEHWETLYRQETEKAEEIERELRENTRQLQSELLELTTELDEVKTRLANQEKVNAEYEKFSELADSDSDDRISVLKGQFKHLLDTYNQISSQYEHLSKHTEEQAAELEELRTVQASLQQRADKRVADMTAEMQHEREKADKARAKLSSFEKNYTELLRSYREMNDKLVKLRQKVQS